MKKQNSKKNNIPLSIRIILLFIIILFLTVFLSAANPSSPNVVSVSNETKSNSASAAFLNISGGVISALNLTSLSQNYRWKAFIGWVNGKFTLDDAGGGTIYDWSLTTTTGRLYSTRDSGTIEWSSLVCANRSTNLLTEQTAMFHNSSSDNLTMTFQYGTHDPFWAAGRFINGNSCPTINTYTNNATQDNYFEEMALYDATSIIYTTILENDLQGYDGQTYDFQMLVPENGSQGFTGATAYYLYVELD